MSISHHFDHPQKQHNKEYFTHLVRIAKADGHVSQRELKLLNRIGRKLGFTEPEIESLIDTKIKLDYIAPYELAKRFDQLYEIVKMTLADGIMDLKEMHLASGFAVKSGFDENEIPDLLLLLKDGIREGKDEEDLFAIYKKQKQS
jgi:uncharacterized tellurite resistance protein B-like protein